MNELALLRPAFVEQMAAAAGKAARVEARAQAGAPGTAFGTPNWPLRCAGRARRRAMPARIRHVLQTCLLGAARLPHFLFFWKIHGRCADAPCLARQRCRCAAAAAPHCTVRRAQ